MSTANSILLVEDNEDDVFLMKRALKGAGITNPLRIVEDGQRAIDYFSGTGEFADRGLYPIPAVVFLDLKLPIKMGLDVLAWIRAREAFATLVIVVLTSSNEASDVKKAYGLGANSYVVKPPTADQLLDLAKAFKWYWLEFNQYDRLSV
jgi:CheY-like chemotaxis protein